MKKYSKKNEKVTQLVCDLKKAVNPLVSVALIPAKLTYTEVFRLTLFEDAIEQYRLALHQQSSLLKIGDILALFKQYILQFIRFLTDLKVSVNF